jgi:hypothetical protein
MMEPQIIQIRRLASPAITPQALAWHSNKLWMGSRDLRRIYAINTESWTVVSETEAPGIPWAAVSTNGTVRFTIGEGVDDDRYIRAYDPAAGFGMGRIACPEFTGSYLSFDGDHLYLSQWYKHRILKLDANGRILRIIDVGAEISGHVFVDGLIYVLRGTENLQKTPNVQHPTSNAQLRSGAEPGNDPSSPQDESVRPADRTGEYWHIARLDPRQETPDVQDLARVPFASRSLTFDGENFWTNHRAANETVSFALPD